MTNVEAGPTANRHVAHVTASAQAIMKTARPAKARHATGMAPAANRIMQRTSPIKKAPNALTASKTVTMNAASDPRVSMQITDPMPTQNVLKSATGKTNQLAKSLIIRTSSPKAPESPLTELPANPQHSRAKAGPCGTLPNPVAPPV